MGKRDRIANALARRPVDRMPIGWEKFWDDLEVAIWGEGGMGGGWTGKGRAQEEDWDWFDPETWFHEGGTVPKTGIYKLQQDEVITDKHSSPGTTNIFNIDLRNAIVDNRAKLVRDITEQVIMRIG